MQTVQFQCGHCGKLMAVGIEHLGQQVRCPHCQQVVVAPPPAPPPESAPQPEPEANSGLVETILHSPPPVADADDIFAPTEVSDDLFGRSEPPRIEIPPEPLAPTLASEHSASPPAPTLESTLATTGMFPPSNGESTTTLPADGSEAPWMAPTLTATFEPAAAEAPTVPQPEAFGEGAPAAPRPQRRKEQKTPWFLILVFSPLLLYAIVITVFAVLLYQHEQRIEDQLRRHFEMMPDEGDNPGVQKGKKTTRVYRYKPSLATQPLPANLCTTLGPDDKAEPLRIGDLQITPQSVKRERVKLITEGFPDDPNPRAADSLLLSLKMKNLSAEYAFAPLDNYFDRYWREGQDQLPPLTQLEVGNAYRFYGGPAHWYPRGDQKNRREWVVGRKGFEADLLEPGEEREFFVCTDGGDPRGVLALFGERDGERLREPYHGSLLWRIRVRRGLVTINDKQYSATAVVGIRFTDKVIK